MQVQRYFKTLAAMAVAAGVVFGSSLASAVAPPSNLEAVPAESEDRSSRVWNLTPGEQSALAAKGATARALIESARIAAAAGESDSALSQLEQARTLLEGVMDASPAIRTKSRLWVAMNMAALEESERVLEYMGEVDDEIAAMASYAEVDAVRARVAEARHLLGAGQGPEAAAALEAAGEAVELGRADVPTAEAFYLVNVAMAATVQGDASVAGKALEMASKSADGLVAAVPAPDLVANPSAG